MKRRSFLVAGCAGTFAAALPGRFTLARETAFSASAYRRAIVIDALVHPGETDPYAPLSTQTLEYLRTSGLTAVNVTIGGIGTYAVDFDKTVRNIAYWNNQIAAHPDRLLLVRTPADITEAKRSGRVGLIYGFQDGTPLGEDTTRVEVFDQLGVRIVQLTYNRRNLIGDGCLESANAGLSKLGFEIIEQLNARNMLVDLSHGGERTTRDAIVASKAPVTISHTGCAALAALPRNKTDAELRMLAERGGVAGIYSVPYFLTTEGQPTAQDVVRHIEHAVDVCGEDHVGIGTDGQVAPVRMDDADREKYARRMAERRSRGLAAPGERPDVSPYLPDLNSADRFARIADLLASRGYSEARIEKILGGNFARLFGEVWTQRSVISKTVKVREGA